MAETPLLTIRPSSKQYRKYFARLGPAYALAFGLIVWGFYWASNHLSHASYVAQVIKGIVLFILGSIGVYFFIRRVLKHNGVVVYADKLVHLYPIGSSKIPFASISEVIFVKSYNVYKNSAYPPVATIMLKKTNGKVKEFLLINSGYYAAENIQKLAETVAKSSGKPLQTYDKLSEADVKNL